MVSVQSDDGLSVHGLHKDPHAAAETEHRAKGGLLNVIVGKGLAVLKLLWGKDEALLLGIINCVRGLHCKGDDSVFPDSVFTYRFACHPLACGHRATSLRR